MLSKRGNKTEKPILTQQRLSFLSAGIGLALLSAVGMAFEVVLTHLYSEIFQYHFAFLAVSTAILGLGLGAAVSFRLPKIQESHLSAWLSQGAAIISILLPLMVIVFIITGFIPGYILQITIGAVPFLFVGLITSILFNSFYAKAAWLYALDLTGAALGLFGVLGLLNILSAANVGILLGGLAAVASLVFIGRNRNGFFIPLVAMVLISAVFIVNVETHLVDLPMISTTNIPPDKTMYQVLSNNTDSRLIDSAWSSYARVDLVTGSNADEMYAFTNAGAGSYMLAFDGDLQKVKWLQNQVEYLPFVQFTPENTLIMGAGAGKDILQALLAGSHQITAVEVNPAMVALTRRHADFNGNILDYPGVTTVIADGRDYVSRSNTSYDMIYMNLVYSQAPTPGSNALSEAYVFTTEAFKQYWQHLAENGRLAIVSHQGLEGARAMITANQALQDEGIAPKDALKHMALLMYSDPSDVTLNTSVFVLQKSALSDAQVMALNTAGQLTGMSPLFMPNVFETLFRGLNTGEITLDEYLVQPSGYNLFPTYDNRPFFFNLNLGIPDALKILLIISGIAMLLYQISIIGSKHKPRFSYLVVFGGLGVGYFMIEMPLIQRSQLLSGNPTLAMVIVLAALLLGGGSGSFISSRWKIKKLWGKIAFVAIIIALLSFLFAFFQPNLFDAVFKFNMFMRGLITFLCLLPLGFFMGIPFANGLRLAGEKDSQVLPYLWGWNAVTSVTGSALTSVLAMIAGFQANILVGSACYLVVALTAWIISRKG